LDYNSGGDEFIDDDEDPHDEEVVIFNETVKTDDKITITDAQLLSPKD
jgi:hypothetical protein